MGSVKRWIEQMEADEAMHEWISDHVDIGVEEGDPEWEAMKEQFLSGEVNEEHFWDDDYFDDELNRLTADGVAYLQFETQLNLLKEELPDAPSDSTIKMTYSYSITLMETCLGDMIKSLLLSDDYYLSNAINNVDELNKIKLPLKEVYLNNEIVHKVVIKTFSDYLYHNVEKIVPIYSAVLGEKTPIDLKDKIPEIVNIAKVRHDIVHRNGADKEGNPRDLNKQVLLKAMEDIYDFVKSVSESIEGAKLKRVPKL
ncbi:hypothetical protein M977_00422 [Buttiauxella gaviniae ATCC 51604]|uniref:RiboL-PSP-HEPN domain-containing protein n=1 Tax=Buttiauxella gaviniae ATCC 51604 TaxID=1354253 RepID=A0A1B7I6R3_9ENTR|nr:hypothetical protein [Buttiauxella gaviniae]OAT24130.1 hypothetical protein M977_00422 [Buttiauxella gaviniae ATCC 51604]